MRQTSARDRGNIRYKNEAVETWKVSKTENKEFHENDSLVYEYIRSEVFLYYGLNTGLLLMVTTNIYNSEQDIELEGIYDTYAEAIE